MIRLGCLTGLPVVLDGRTIGHIEQAALTPDGHALRGVTVRHGLGMARWVDEKDIAIIGAVAVIVRSKPVKPPRDACYSLGPVWDTAGLPLGYVTDACLCPGTRRIHALEISLGPLESLRLGRFLVRDYTVTPQNAAPARVMIPCGCALEHIPSGRMPYRCTAQEVIL